MHFNVDNIAGAQKNNFFNAKQNIIVVARSFSFEITMEKKAGKVLYFHTETTCVTGSLHLKLYRFFVATIFRDALRFFIMLLLVFLRSEIFMA